MKWGFTISNREHSSTLFMKAEIIRAIVLIIQLNEKSQQQCSYKSSHIPARQVILHILKDKQLWLLEGPHINLYIFPTNLCFVYLEICVHQLWPGESRAVVLWEAGWLRATEGTTCLGRSRGCFANPFCQHSGSYLNFIWVLTAVWVGFLSVRGAAVIGLKPQLLGST